MNRDREKKNSGKVLFLIIFEQIKKNNKKRKKEKQGKFY